MTAGAPRAVGVRLPYEQIPVRVRRWVESELGSRVRAFQRGEAARVLAGARRGLQLPP